VAQDGQAQPIRVRRLELHQIHECVAVSGFGRDDEVMSIGHLADIDSV
jgi:hypothetical protein